MAWMLVAYSVGIVAEASSASPAVIFPAVSAWVKIVSRIACCAVMEGQVRKAAGGRSGGMAQDRMVLPEIDHPGDKVKHIRVIGWF